MQTTFWLAVVPAGLIAMTAPAQSVFVYGAVNYGSAGAPACPGSTSPVLVRTAPAACILPGAAVAVPVVSYQSPNIIYVGAASGYPHPNYFSGWGYGPGYPSYYAPNVIYFGSGQAWAHGYAFRHCR
jgi:hypothetical protein